MASIDFNVQLCLADVFTSDALKVVEMGLKMRLFCIFHALLTQLPQKNMQRYCFKLYINTWKAFS